MTAPVVDPTPPVDPAPAVPGAPAPSPAPQPFDPKSLSLEAQAYLDSERARIKADEGARERTTSKANAEAAERQRIAQLLGYAPTATPEDVAKQLTEERAARQAERVENAVEKAASKAGADDDLVVAHLARQGKLKGLDPSASDFADRVKALVDAALVEKPSLNMATAAPAPTPPGGQGPGAGVTPGAQPPPRTRPDLMTAYANHYAAKTQ